jgi:hypothetical protein
MIAEHVYTVDRRSEILAELAQIDRDSIRAMRAIIDGTATEFDRTRLAALDARAVELREELSYLV